MTEEKQATFGIGLAARAVGVSVQTIRRWEREGRLPFRPQRSPTGRRIFTAEDVTRLQGILRELHPEAVADGC